MSRVRYTADTLYLHVGGTKHSSNLIRIVRETGPDEIYSLAAQSHVLCHLASADMGRASTGADRSWKT
ncbi:MAG: GDP-mannose 4,6-dehydratase [Alphaproteobacteria bacterium]